MPQGPTLPLHRKSSTPLHVSRGREPLTGCETKGPLACVLLPKLPSDYEAQTANCFIRVRGLMPKSDGVNNEDMTAAAAPPLGYAKGSEESKRSGQGFSLHSAQALLLPCH